MGTENLKCSFKKQYQDICRLCAKRREYLIPIFNEDGRNQDIKMKIDIYLPVKVECDDFLPIQVCDRCVSAMATWDHFSANCLAAERRLRAITCSECSKIHDVPDDVESSSSSVHTAITSNSNPVQEEISDKPQDAEDSDVPGTHDITSRECSTEGQV
ncbi:uncharacterized protein [Anabrus simplex]|uniref:uncharacterized protein n=1 Tax=Anabrus simplex TaxID=316456 RepID=UPI0035A2C3A3